MIVTEAGGEDACPSCAKRAETDYQMRELMMQDADTVAKAKAELERISRRLLILENDDTVGHTYNGPYFTEVRQLRRRHRELSEQLEAAEA